MMRYPRILSAIRSAKWAATPETLQAIRDTLSARLTGRMSIESMPEYNDANEQLMEPFEVVSSDIAIVTLRGIIGKNLSKMEMMCGGCDLVTVEENLTAAIATPSVRNVILTIDSPGGTVNGVAELSAKISQLSIQSGKNVIAWIDGYGCSAAYWIACGCNGIFCSPSSDVGCIGVYQAIVDESAAWEKEGYKLVLIKAGEHKADGIAGSKITDEQIAIWKLDIDEVYKQFCKSVLSARPSVATDVMQGQKFYGARAFNAGLVDGVYQDIEQLVSDMIGNAKVDIAAIHNRS